MGKGINPGWIMFVTGLGRDRTGRCGMRRCAAQGTRLSSTGGKDATVSLSIQCAPVSDLVKLLKAGCGFRSEMDVVLIKTRSARLRMIDM